MCLLVIHQWVLLVLCVGDVCLSIVHSMSEFCPYAVPHLQVQAGYEPRQNIMDMKTGTKLEMFNVKHVRAVKQLVPAATTQHFKDENFFVQVRRTR